MSRKSVRPGRDGHRRLVASMGPRQKCLGNVVLPCGAQVHGLRFNGAETKMSRKSLSYTLSFLPDSKLQWGRDKNVSEIPRTVGQVSQVANASMGPRQKCLGNINSTVLYMIDESCFNGAETKMSRKCPHYQRDIV